MLENYAASELSVGQKVVSIQGLWWRQVRPCFFRPLLPFREYAPESVRAPASSFLGGIQHLVPAACRANSTMSFLMFEDSDRYVLEHLDYNRKRQVRLAGRRFVVRPLASPDELADNGHSAYLSFYKRTGYSVLPQRRTAAGFRAWAQSVFAFQPVLAFGAYEHNELAAVCIARAVEDTMFYATFFARSDALKHHISDLMLHTVRQAAARTSGIRQVFCGMHERGQGTEGFYLLRGATRVTRPAWLRINPAASCLLRYFLPSSYLKMRGESLFGMPIRPKGVTRGPQTTKVISGT